MASGGMTGSGEDAQRGNSNHSGESSETSASSATSGGSRKKKKKGGKPMSLQAFYKEFAGEVKEVQHEGQSTVAAPRTRPADPPPVQPQPHVNTEIRDEFPLLAASSASSSVKQNAHAAADSPDRAAHVPTGEEPMEEEAPLLPLELASLKAAAAELSRLKARERLMEALAREGNAKLKSESNVFEREFAHVLQTYNMIGRLSYYGCRALQMAPTADFIFKVDFAHILDLGYIDLALEIVNKGKDPSKWWLLGTTINFLRTLRLLDPDELQCVILEFENFPKTMKSFAQYDAAELVQEDASPFGQEHRLVTSLYVGRQIYISGLTHVLEQNHAGKTWGGQFEAKDIYVIVFSRTSILCKIRASVQTLVCSPENKVLDLKKMHQIMAVKYQLAGHFPPHFECLEKDISLLDAAAIDRGSVLQYLPYHVALMPLGANEYLTEKLHKATESVWIPPEEFTTYVAMFESPPDNVDWRQQYKESKDKLLTAVYKHDGRAIKKILDESIGLVQEDATNTVLQEDATNTVLQEDATNTVLQEDVTNTVLQEKASQDSSSSSASSVKQKFKRTRKGKLAFKRHQEDATNTVLQEDTTNTVLQEDATNTVLQENASQDSSSSSASSVKQKFKRTRKGKLAFKRHLDVHLHNHMAGKRPLRGMFQAEAYSSKNNNVLGEIFTDLFSGPSMKLQKFLGPIMKHYRLLRDMDDE